MKRSLSRRGIASKVVAWACLGIGLLAAGCSGRNVRPSGLPNQSVQSIEMEDLHITVGKGAKGGEEDFIAYDAPTDRKSVV